MKRSPMSRRRSPMKRTGRLSPIGAKARREAPALAEFRRVLRERSGGMCEARTPACAPGSHEGHHAHHCAPSDRDRGVHDPERGLLLCAPAHDWTHMHPAEAYDRGLLIRGAA